MPDQLVNAPGCAMAGERDAPCEIGELLSQNAAL